MKVYRYSDTGFEPQLQTHHYKTNIKPYLDDETWQELLDCCQGNEYQLSLLKKGRDILKPFYEEHLLDFKYGIWVFTTENFHKMSLNHLKRRVAKWEAELPDNTLVYDVNWEKQTRLSDPINKPFGCYVPERSLEFLTNVRRVG